MRAPFLFLAVFSILVIFTMEPTANAATQYTVGNGATVTVDEFGVCKDVTNNHASGNSIMCPTNSANEWHTGGSSFLENLPAGVTAANCATGGNCTPAQENTWTQVANLPQGTELVSTSTLSDGRVLFCGGSYNNATSTSNRCDIYDPTSNSFTQVANLPQAKYEGSASTLSDGRVLICGGVAGVSRTNRCDIYDPVVNSFTQVANLPQVKTGHSSASLSDGRVLICGGWNGAEINRCDIYDPVANSFTQVANLPQAKWRHSATTLSGGRVLICGGETAVGATNRCDIYDSVVNSWTQVATLPESKSGHSSATLSDGQVLLCGGFPSIFSESNRCDIYDPVANSFTQVANLPLAKFWYSSATLSDGRVLLCGGYSFAFGGSNNRCDIYNVNCSAPTCAGTLVGGYCWYLGGVGQSCDTVCSVSGRGGYNNATKDYAGSAGTNANCLNVVIAFGRPSVFDVSCNPGLGLGCTDDPDTSGALRCISPVTNSTSSFPSFVRFCACNN